MGPIGDPPSLRCLFTVFGFEFTIGTPTARKAWLVCVGLRRLPSGAGRLSPRSAGGGQSGAHSLPRAGGQRTAHETASSLGGRSNRHTAKSDLLSGGRSQICRISDLSIDTIIQVARAVGIRQGNRMPIRPVVSAGRMGGRCLAWNTCHDRPVPLMALVTEVDAPRRPQGQYPSLESILLIAMLAVICGADSWTGVEFFGCRKQAWLATFPGCRTACPRTTPSGASSASSAQLKACFAAWVQSLATALGSGQGLWEDESRIRTGHAAHNMWILRRLVLNLLRRETTAKGGIAARRKQAGWNDGYLFRVLSR